MFNLNLRNHCRVLPNKAGIQNSQSLYETVSSPEAGEGFLGIRKDGGSKLVIVV
jgi:hypothetical protein